MKVFVCTAIFKERYNNKPPSLMFMGVETHGDPRVNEQAP